MRNARPRTIDFYQFPNGHEPFTRWFRSIRDTSIRRRIQARFTSVRAGNLGDHRSVGDGVWELRLDFGPGYRIYYGEVDNTVVLLLCGAINPHRDGILNAQKIIGKNTKRDTNNENLWNMGRIPCRPT